MKNVIIFLAGALFGVGGIYIYHSQNGSVELNSAESKVDAKSESITDEPLNLNISKTEQALLQEIESLKVELAEKEIVTVSTGTKAVTEEKSSDISDESEMSDEDFSREMIELFQKRNKPNAEEERVGSIALEELKRNQPVELKTLFNEDPNNLNPMNTQIENQYKKHLSQEKDINWAYEADGFLKNYFSTVQGSNFTAMRIDCRTRTCEVAGLFVFESDIEGGSQEEMMMSGQMSQRIQSFMKVRQDIQKHPFYENYFESGVSNMHFSPQALTLNPMPYSFFLNRGQAEN